MTTPDLIANHPATTVPQLTHVQLLNRFLPHFNPTVSPAPTTMGTPQAHLPPPFANGIISTLVDSLSLPRPSSIQPLQVTAAFHSIYLINYDVSVDLASFTDSKLSRNPDGSLTLVLRISGNHIPHRKTANEVAVLQWLRANTGIPVPAVVRHDCSVDNALGREFTLLERVPGRSVDGMYDELDDAAKRRLVEQLTDFLVELNAHEWSNVGGLQLEKLNDAAVIVPGPVLEDTFWLVPDIERFWGPGESIDTLNPSGPYSSHEGLVRGYLGVFIHAINTHESLSWLRNTLLPGLEKLGSMDIPQLASSRLILAHKDLHFANVMATADGTVTGILDWEFAGVVPALRWDPVRAFLWNGKQDEASAAEKERMRAVFEEVLESRGVEPWWTGVPRETELVWTVVKFTRALVEVCPRGQKMEAVEGWRDAALGALTELGISSGAAE